MTAEYYNVQIKNCSVCQEIWSLTSLWVLISWAPRFLTLNLERRQGISCEKAPKSHTVEIAPLKETLISISTSEI